MRTQGEMRKLVDDCNADWQIAFEAIEERQIAINAGFLPSLGNDKTPDDSPVGVRPKGRTQVPNNQKRSNKFMLHGLLCGSGWFVHRSSRSKFGRKPVSSPIRGRKEQTQYTYSMLVRSASWPKTADPMPAIPKAKPKKSPDISPT
jgi:hypothetical protein